jgi:hypothetical protein
MVMGDLLTLRPHELPAKLIVFRNDALAFVELEMRAAGILEFGTICVIRISRKSPTEPDFLGSEPKRPTS